MQGLHRNRRNCWCIILSVLWIIYTPLILYTGTSNQRIFWSMKICPLRFVTLVYPTLSVNHKLISLNKYLTLLKIQLLIRRKLKIKWKKNNGHWHHICAQGGIGHLRWFWNRTMTQRLTFGVLDVSSTSCYTILAPTKTHPTTCSSQAPPATLYHQLKIALAKYKWTTKTNCSKSSTSLDWSRKTSSIICEIQTLWNMLKTCAKW